MLKILKGKERAYRLSLGNESGKEVIADLRSYCNGTRSNFNSDPLEMARMEGRREVFMRIVNFMKIDYEQYYDYEESLDE